MKWEKFSGWLALFIMGIGMLLCLQFLQGKWGEWGAVPDSQQIQGVYKAEKEEPPVIEVLEKTWTAQSVVSVKEMVRAEVRRNQSDRESKGTDTGTGAGRYFLHTKRGRLSGTGSRSKR